MPFFQLEAKQSIRRSGLARQKICEQNSALCWSGKIYSEHSLVRAKKEVRASGTRIATRKDIQFVEGKQILYWQTHNINI